MHLFLLNPRRYYSLRLIKFSPTNFSHTKRKLNTNFGHESPVNVVLNSPFSKSLNSTLISFVSYAQYCRKHTVGHCNHRGKVWEPWGTEKKARVVIFVTEMHAIMWVLSAGGHVPVPCQDESCETSTLPVAGGCEGSPVYLMWGNREEAVGRMGKHLGLRGSRWWNILGSRLIPPKKSDDTKYIDKTTHIT